MLLATQNSHRDMSQKVSRTALKIAVEKDDYWEFLLVGQLLNDFFERSKNKRLDAELGISFGTPIELHGITEVSSWVVSTKITSMLQTVDHLEKAMNNGYPKAVGEPGVEGDLTRIIHFVSRFSEAYEHILDWRLQFERVEVEAEFQKIIDLASTFTMNVIVEIEKFVSGLSKSIYSSIEKAENSEEMVREENILTLTAPDITEFIQEMERLKARYQI